MNGSLFFLVDLLKHMPPDYHVECWRVQSYHGEASTGKLEGLEYTSGNFQGYDVLIIDDVLDTGLTLHAVKKRVLELGARRADICVLLKKRGTQKNKVIAKWIGFEIGKEFVIGYGLDLDGKYRGYKDIRVMPS
jgi:hypoxanthine phosphoribosyltransferase